MRVLARPAYKGTNPYCRLLSTALEKQGVEVLEFATRPRRGGIRYDIYHFHWPRSALEEYAPTFIRAVRQATTFLRELVSLRSRGTRLVWTVHDIHSHERSYPRLEIWFDRCFMPLIDGTIYLSETSRDAARVEHPVLARKPTAVIPHGHYRDIHPNPVARTAARQALGLPLDAPILVFGGRIRPYKNVPHLIRQFRALSDPNLRLAIAGKPKHPNDEQQVRDTAAGDPRLILDLDYIQEEKLQLYLRAADLVVLPFSETTNSGSALLALSLDRPILVPDRGSLPELQRRVGIEWVQLYSQPLEPRHLQAALPWALSTPRSERAPLDSLNWEAIGAQTCAFYRQMINPDR